MSFLWYSYKGSCDIYTEQNISYINEMKWNLVDTESLSSKIFPNVKSLNKIFVT